MIQENDELSYFSFSGENVEISHRAVISRSESEKQMLVNTSKIRRTYNFHFTRS